MNTKLLRKVQRFIKAEPRRLNMYDFGYVTDSKAGPPYGTVACIGGWAVILSDTSKKSNAQKCEAFVNTYQSSHSQARKALQLTESQAARLFYLDQWPSYLHEAYLQDKDQATQARINLFIKSKGRE